MSQKAFICNIFVTIHLKLTPCQNMVSYSRNSILILEKGEQTCKFIWVGTSLLCLPLERSVISFCLVVVRLLTPSLELMS
jgi:hypothetical protein